MSFEKQKSKGSGISGMVFVGCLMIALAIGLFTGNMAPAILAGLGIAFILTAVVRYRTGEW